jgi:hypothetical protein
MAAKMVQYHINATGAVFSLVGLAPQTSDNPSWTPVSNTVSTGANLPGAADLAAKMAAAFH